jgi:hypothetical protein
MQQKLNKRSKEAMEQREITPEIKPTRADVRLLGLDDDRPETIADKHRKAVSIEIQLANMANNSIIDELGWKPSKIKSEVTQRMIDEYKAEMNKPVKVFNPNVGRDGKYAVYKYKPSTIDLTPVPPEDLGTVLSDAEIKNLSASMIQLNHEYKKLDKAQREFPTLRKTLEDEYNRAKATELRAAPAGAVKDDAFYDGLITELNKYDKQIKGVDRKVKQNEIAVQLGITANARNIADNKAKILAEIARQRSAPPPVSKAETDFIDAIGLLEDEITATDDRQKEIKMLIDEIRINIADNKKIIHENAIKQAEADKLTKSKVNEAMKELELLNSGKSIPTQQVGESDDDYRLILQEIGNEVLDDAEVEREAGLLQNVKAKYN